MVNDRFGVSLALYGCAGAVVLSDVTIPDGLTSSKSAWRNLLEVKTANPRLGS